MEMTKQALSDYAIVYIPSISKSGRPCASAYYTDKVSKKFAILFGGFTTTQSIGGYVDTEGKLIQENVTLIKSFLPNLDNETQLNLFRIASNLKVEMEQESIALEVSGQMFFV